MVAAFNEFLDAKGPDRKFIGGDKPNLADLVILVEILRHLSI